MVYTLLLLNVLLLVVGQIFFKMGLEQAGGFHLSNWMQVFLSPWILTGLFLYVLATGLWFGVLSRENLSVAYPLQSLSYVFGVIAAWLIFHEPVSFTRWMGVVVIMIGVALIVR
jgi:drug/metabolite transporter (DMT)-like permease